MNLKEEVEELRLTNYKTCADNCLQIQHILDYISDELEKEQEPCSHCDGREKKTDGFFLRRNTSFRFWELIYRRETEQGNIDEIGIEVNYCPVCGRKLEGEGE